MKKTYDAESVLPEINYSVVNIANLTYEQWNKYWTAVQKAGLLKSRLPDCADPVMKDVTEMCKIKTNICFYIVENSTGDVVADMMFNNVQGLSAYIHFSFNPRCFGKEAQYIARFAIKEAFSIKHQHSGQTLQTLIGVTPINNKLAINFIGKLEFKKLDIITKVFYNRYSGKYTDAYISKLTKEDCTWVEKEAPVEVAVE